MILYTPIDIPCPAPDLDKFENWFNNNYILDNKYKKYVGEWHDYAAVALRINPDNWRSSEILFDWLTQRHIVPDANLYFNPTFEKLFPDLVECVTQLPFKQIGAVAAMKQIGEVGHHSDKGCLLDGVEPRRYSIYLTNSQYNTFYLYNNNQKVYPMFDDMYRCFAFNNFETTHGADTPIGLKIIFLVSGILDEEKHAELIARSIKKFSNKAIIV
jgi:hypothetical protein